MAEIDIKKSAEAIAESLANYFEQFILLLTKPRAAVEAQFASTVTPKKRIQNALIYAASSIFLGICFARFIGLPNSPNEVNPQTAVAVLLLWILSGGILHPFLKLFRAKGVLQDTVVVFLIMISTLHLLFIPALAVASHALTDTKVTLSYDYVIYFGPPEVRGEYASGEGIGRVLTENWRKQLVGKHTESFIKEKESARDKTVLPPAPDLSSYISPATVPLSPENMPRVSPSTVNLQPPERSEVPVVRDGVKGFLLGFWILYYLTNSAYLAAGLSIPHQRNAYFLFSLSVIGPLAVGLLVLLALAFLMWVKQ